MLAQVGMGITHKDDLLNKPNSVKTIKDDKRGTLQLSVTIFPPNSRSFLAKEGPEEGSVS